MQHLGDSFPGIEADLLRSYPRLRAEDLVHAWSYYQPHREEIDRQIRDNEAA